jgi:hypothetical protein
MNIRQSTRHLLMIEPREFYANPQTMDTNVYQAPEAHETPQQIYQKALQEFYHYRNILVQHGVIITTAFGYQGCPDMVFPNWMSTTPAGHFFVHPMLNENRRAERAPEIINFYKSRYGFFHDWTSYENDGYFLESTASIVADHINKVGYSGLSARTSRELVEKWGQETGYDMVIFETQSHTGKPVYHTDFMMYIGTEMAGVCSACIVEKDRARVLNRIKDTHQVIEFTMPQLQANCGNALEVLGAGDEKMLTMSSAAFKALSSDQKSFLQQFYKNIIHAPLDTLEKYGGGSARCMLMEIF